MTSTPGPITASASPPAAGGALDLTVVVPAHNEQDRLADTLTAVAAHLRGHDTPGGFGSPGDSGDPAQLAWEIIVVDDGSTDGTAALAAAAALEEPRIRLLRTPENRGKGHAVRRGIGASRGRLVLFSDADLATPIAELDRLRAALESGHAAAIASRARPASRIQVHQHPVRESLGRLGNRLIRVVAVPGIADTQCGFKLFDGDKARLVFSLTRVDGWAFDVEVLHLYSRLGWTIAEVPVSWSHRPGSKVRPLDYLTVLADVLAIRFRVGSRRTARQLALAAARNTNPPAARNPDASPGHHRGETR